MYACVCECVCVSAHVLAGGGHNRCQLQFFLCSGASCFTCVYACTQALCRAAVLPLPSREGAHRRDGRVADEAKEDFAAGWRLGSPRESRQAVQGAAHGDQEVSRRGCEYVRAHASLHQMCIANVAVTTATSAIALANMQSLKLIG